MIDDLDITLLTDREKVSLLLSVEVTRMLGTLSEEDMTCYEDAVARAFSQYSIADLQKLLKNNAPKIRSGKQKSSALTDEITSKLNNSIYEL